MIYKHRYLAITTLFIVIFSLGVNLFGYVGCGDGWNSPSIGLRGACSHHGGVDSNILLIFLIAGCLSGIAFFLVESSYRVYNKIIVSAKLPRHPLEADLTSRVQFNKHPLPTSEAISRKDFWCNICKEKFSKGTRYKYFPAGNHRVKYCTSCASKIKSINESIKSSEVEYNKIRSAKINEINEYYKNNAKAFID